MAPKGKQGTKGQKQIMEDNKSTLQFYLFVIAGANVTYFLFTYFLFWDDFTTLYTFLVCMTVAVYFGSYKFMANMAQPTYDSSSGTLLDGGIDLNMEQGMAEHMKDLILLTAAVQVLTLLSNYFWFFLLLGPGRAVYLLWVNILAPWFFAPPPEVEEKKHKKMERRMKRQR